MTWGTRQVFADPRGRRRIILLPLAIGAGSLLCGFVIIVGVGFLGGPEVPFLRVAHAHPGGTSYSDPSSHRAAASVRPAASPTPAPTAGAIAGQPQASSPSQAPAQAGASTNPANRAGKTPPGLARAGSPTPRGNRP